MTMEHIARSFQVSLCVKHPHIDPARITAALKLSPKRTMRAAAPRTTPRGDPLGGTYDFTYWTHKFDVKSASELGVVLEDLVERLQKHKRFFHRIVREGGTVELFCGVFAAGNWDEVLSHTLMSQLAALRVDLRLDVYPKKDTAAKPVVTPHHKSAH